MRALVVTGGRLEDAFAEDYIRRHAWDMAIAVDSGMGFFCRSGRTPDYIVGDFDSADPKELSHFAREGKAKILRFEPEKDETDTEIAIRTAIGKGCDSIHLLGATGSRIDHVMGNIHLLGMAMERGAECVMADPNNRIRLARSSFSLSRGEQYGTYVSLFPFTPQVRGLTLTGFKYPLRDAVLECYHSLGVSNEIVGERAEVSFREGTLLVIESRDR